MYHFLFIVSTVIFCNTFELVSIPSTIKLQYKIFENKYTKKNFDRKNNNKIQYKYNKKAKKRLAFL